MSCDQVKKTMLDYRAHTFLEVYRRRSITQAANFLMLSQPAVSQHIKQLEAHYQCALFSKTGRGIEPTPAADVLYTRLLTMENDEQRMQSEIADLARPGHAATRAPIRLGCTRTIADYVAPCIISAHIQRHPTDPVTVRSGNTRDLLEAIEGGVIDFALVEGSFDRSRFSHEVLTSEAYIAVSSPDASRPGARPPSEDGHPGPHGAIKPYEATEPANPPARPDSIRDLLDRRLILRESGSGTREILEKHLAAHDLAISDFAGTVEIESIPTIKTCVKRGAGITFAYRAAVQRELDACELIDITPRDFEIEHDFSLIWQRGSQYSERYRTLCASWRGLLQQHHLS